jgi:hypothetical protein
MGWRQTVLQCAFGAVVGVTATLLVARFFSNRDPHRPSPPNANTPLRSPAELDELHRRRSEVLGQALESERRDDEWAVRAESDLRHQLAANVDAGMGVTLQSVDCRSSICRARLRWSTHADATRGYAFALEARYELNCETTIYLPKPEQPDTSYEADFYFDCRSAKRGSMPNR